MTAGRRPDGEIRERLGRRRLWPNHGDPGDDGGTKQKRHGDVGGGGRECVCPEMSVAPIFGWMEDVPYRLAQPPNMASRGLVLERLP